MTINNKFLLSTVCALSLMSSMPVWADETEEEEDDGWVSVVDETKPAVLFKIHDIKPIRNREGKITNCEFGATFYNRSEDDVKNINMDLTWEDKAIEDVIDMEKKVAKKKMENDYYNSEAMGTLSEPDSETEKYTRKVLTTTLKVPNLQPYRQVSLKSRIRSDRCFLMVNDVKFKFTSCDVSGKEEKNFIFPLSFRAGIYGTKTGKATRKIKFVIFACSFASIAGGHTAFVRLNLCRTNGIVFAEDEILYF